MNKASIIVAILVVLGVGGIVAATQLRTNNDSDMSDMSNMSEMNGADSGSSSKSMDKGEQDLTAQKEVTMDIKDFDFAQPNITIKAGTKVTWTNADSARHDVVADGEAPEGFGSELLAKGESYSFTFTEPGMTMYLCQPHPYMKGMINVVE